MRAMYPDAEGFVERGGVKVGYEVFGAGEAVILLFTSWAIVHARQWKAQVPYLARHFRVIAVEGRGNGRADRPAEPGAYRDREYVDDAVAVLDAVGVDRVVAVGVSLGGRHALQLAAWYPERVAGVAAIGAALPWPLPPDFDEQKPCYEGAEKVNSHYWLADYRGWVEFFMSLVFTEPHSTKQREDGVAWGMETSPETLVLTARAADADGGDAAAEAVCRQVRCPVLVVHGEGDLVVPHETGVALARMTGGQLVTIRGGGHAPTMRDPVRMNLLIRDFTESLGPRPRTTAVPRSWTRARDRRKRVLYVSSPIGLGHVRRDLAIATELRARHPDLLIDWLAQPPVTAVLEERGERVHPASRVLASESSHIESEAGEHDLHVFQALRRMDETLVANFMVFHELVRDEPYDLWVADEGWDIDYFLHENPELKRAPYAWMTDFVGWLPTPDGGAAERALTADYNAEMIEQIARFPSVRDRAVFVGNPGDVVPDAFGDGLPLIRDWVEGHFRFSGYITGLPDGPGDREALRAELGYRPGEPVCVVTVGGSGVGTSLLRRAAAAFPAARRLIPGLRMVIVTGPRIDPASLPSANGLDVRGYVPDLYRHLVACDLAVVQGGLTTTMELTAARRPFLYVPLHNHFEQNFHVRQRLARYGAGRCLGYADTGPDALAAAMAEEIARPVSYRPVETDGAARAAACLAELL